MEQNPIKETYTMPKVNLEEMNEGLIRVLDGFKSEDDFNHKKISVWLGQELILKENGHYFFNGQLTSNFQVFVSISKRQNKLAPTFRFSFPKIPHIQKGSLPLTEVCSMDMETLHQRLIKMGYENYDNSHRGGPAKQYLRGKVHLNIRYVGESTEKVKHDCFTSVNASILD